MIDELRFETVTIFNLQSQISNHQSHISMYLLFLENEHSSGAVQDIMETMVWAQLCVIHVGALPIVSSIAFQAKMVSHCLPVNEDLG
jgi:hypothetical protein